MTLTWSTADECLSERWDDRNYVVDPDSRLRRFSHRPGVIRTALTQESLGHLDDPLGSTTYETWCESVGFDPVTRTYL